jgi:hypothetical protein
VNVIFGIADLITTVTLWSAIVYWYWPITGPDFFVRWMVPRFVSQDRYVAIAVKCAWFKHLGLRAVLELRFIALITNPISILNFLVNDSHHSLLYRCWIVLCQFVFEWWLWRIGKDDDRWKKRRRKAAAKVKELGGKLVVVPVPAGA